MSAISDSIDVMFNGKSVSKRAITQKLADGDITFSWEPDSFLKTIILYDQDAPYPSPDNDKSPLVHMIAVNVQDKITSSNIILPYMKPNPPDDSPAHTYYVEIYRQKSEVPTRRRKKRENFDLYKYALNNQLTKIGQTYFMVGKKSRTPSFPENGIVYKYGSLDKKHQDYCTCILKVAAKEPAACSLEKAWFERRDGRSCANPYAVCHKTVGVDVRHCSLHYDFSQMSDRYLIVYSNLHGVTVDHPYDRNKLINRITKKLSKIG
jgi:phosphatidylethanolamine-binding protein (PEBP) family uncharacterized protein